MSSNRPRMLRPRGVFLLEMLVYVAIVMLLFGTMIGSLSLISHSLSDSTSREKQAVERDEVADLLRDDLRMSRQIEWLDAKALKNKGVGSVLRLTQPGEVVVEYAFVRKTYDVSFETEVPAAPKPANGRRMAPVLQNPERVMVTQTIEEQPALTRTVLLHGVQKSSRRWNAYELNKLERAPQSVGGGIWQLEPLKMGAEIDARQAHVFVLATLQLALPGKTPATFSVGATTRLERLEPQAAELEKP